MASIAEAFSRPSAPFRARSAGLPPSDPAGYRERGGLWFNNAGKNYTQTSR